MRQRRIRYVGSRMALVVLMSLLVSLPAMPSAEAHTTQRGPTKIADLGVWCGMTTSWIFHGSRGNGDYKVETVTYQEDPQGTCPSYIYTYLGSGRIGAKINVWYCPYSASQCPSGGGGSHWGICTRFNWHYNSGSTYHVISRHDWTSGTPPCSSGFYANNGGGRVCWNGTGTPSDCPWQQDWIWSGPHYYPTSPSALEPAPPANPDWVRLDGSIDTSEMPEWLRVYGSDGSLVGWVRTDWFLGDSTGDEANSNNMTATRAQARAADYPRNSAPAEEPLPVMDEASDSGEIVGYLVNGVGFMADSEPSPSG
jgi:hypothetical protein